jgi:hypothetical protein
MPEARKPTQDRQDAKNAGEDYPQTTPSRPERSRRVSRAIRRLHSARRARKSKVKRQISKVKMPRGGGISGVCQEPGGLRTEAAERNNVAKATILHACSTDGSEMNIHRRRRVALSGVEGSLGPSADYADGSGRSIHRFRRLRRFLAGISANCQLETGYSRLRRVRRFDF